MIYHHNLADVETYKNEFPSAPNITYSPCVVTAQITLGSIGINTAEFIKNIESYRMYIMDYVDHNEVYTLSNFDIFIDRSTAGRSIDWSLYRGE